LDVRVSFKGGEVGVQLGTSEGSIMARTRQKCPLAKSTRKTRGPLGHWPVIDVRCRLLVCIVSVCANYPPLLLPTRRLLFNPHFGHSDILRKPFGHQFTGSVTEIRIHGNSI